MARLAAIAQDPLGFEQDRLAGAERPLPEPGTPARVQWQVDSPIGKTEVDRRRRLLGTGQEQEVIAGCQVAGDLGEQHELVTFRCWQAGRIRAPAPWPLRCQGAKAHLTQRLATERHELTLEESRPDRLEGLPRAEERKEPEPHAWGIRVRVGHPGEGVDTGGEAVGLNDRESAIISHAEHQGSRIALVSTFSIVTSDAASKPLRQAVTIRINAAPTVGFSVRAGRATALACSPAWPAAVFPSAGTQPIWPSSRSK